MVRSNRSTNGDSIYIDSPLVRVVRALLGDGLPVAVTTYDGGYMGPADPPATVEVRGPDALRRLLTAPGELGFARAYVAGDLRLSGDIYAVLALRDTMRQLTPLREALGRDLAAMLDAGEVAA